MTDPGLTPSTASSRSGLAEAEAAGGKPLGQCLEVDPRIVLGDNKNHAAVGVGQEQVLGMRAGNACPQSGRFLDGEHRLMLDRRRCNTEHGEAGIEGLAVSCHGLSVALSRGEVDIRAPIN